MHNLQRKEQIEGFDNKIKKHDGLLGALDSNDKVLLLDFSGSMGCHHENKRLYKHLIDAVGRYENEYPMIAFRCTSNMIASLEMERPGGSTNLTGALQLALEEGGPSTEYIVVGDGLPDYPEQSLVYAKNNKMKISTIFIGNHPRGLRFMERLATETGGKSDDIELLKGFGGLLEQKIAGLIEG